MLSFLLAVYLTLIFIERARSSPAPNSGFEKRDSCNHDNLLNALNASAHLSDSNHFCSAYLSIPPTSTVAVYTSTCILSSFVTVISTYHPLSLYNLQPVFANPTPLSYNSASPTPSPIPGGAQSYGLQPGRPRRDKRDGSPGEPSDAFPSAGLSHPQKLVGRDTVPLPSYLATTYPASRLSSACSCLSVPAAFTKYVSQGLTSIGATTTCTSFVPASVATYAAPCAPSLQVNAPHPNSHPGYKVVNSFPVASKMDCCAACTSVFNCVWWKFDFGTSGNGWAPGMCHYAYYIGSGGDVGTEIPAICPNGMTQGITEYTAQFGREANNNDPGYNFGPCGDAFNNFESNQDEGLPDDFDSRVCPLSHPGCS